MKKTPVLLLFLALCILIGFGRPAASQDNDRVLVFAAASTTNAVTEIMEVFNAKGAGHAEASFASSSTLAKQLEAGAPADMFLSANVEWMDYLEERNLIDKASRKDLLGNRLVVIAPKSAGEMKIDVKSGFPLADLLGDGRLALGDPDHVPAGTYAQNALESLGVWDKVSAKVAPAKDVRAALALVERGECPLGLVYSTDAAISDKVRVVGTVPEEAHTPIVYPAALLAKEARAPVKAFFELLQSAEAKAIFEKYGFVVR